MGLNDPATPFSKSMVCPIVVGRASYFAVLHQHIEQVSQGRGQTLLIAGEAGIGKSRLAAEAIRLARQAGYNYLPGRCFEPDRMLPYAPVLDLLRTYLGTPPSAEVLRSWPPSLTQLLPELETSSPETPAAPRLDPQQERARRFQALLQFLLQQGTPPGPPLLIVIEDLHWADDSSLEFLLHVGRRLPTQRVWMLLTYRNDEMHPALQHFLAEFEHARLATELTLARLSSAEVEAMIRAIFEPPGPVREEFVTALHSRTDGNPFFIEETLKSLVAAGDIYYANGAWTRKPLGELGIPRTVNDAVQRRTRQLSERGGQLLTLAAVAGRRFDLRLLQAVTRQSEEELLRSVKELMAAQLVHEESADQFAFRHELTRQAVVAGLLARERRSLHGQLLQAM